MKTQILLTMKIRSISTFLAFGTTLLFGGYLCFSSVSSAAKPGSDGPKDQGLQFPREDGSAAAGKAVFRFETFGNEGFWTLAVRIPAGVKAAKVTPYQAMKLGLSVDVDAIGSEMRSNLLAELKADPTGKRSSFLNDPASMGKLINSNAIIGMPAIDTNGDGTVNIDAGDQVGTSCALCHTITDGSMFKMKDGGSIGQRLDGLTNHNLNLGRILATAANSRALFPLLQLELKANKGKTIGRAPKGLTENSTEAEVDAYLSNPTYYPVGMFDDSFDGNGNPIHIAAFFRQDLAAPYGSEGSIAKLDHFSNMIYTIQFDLTNLTTSGGRALLNQLAGAAGDEVADSYVKVLTATGVSGYPFVKAKAFGKPGSAEAPIGLQVDQQKLIDLNGYLASLPAPTGIQVSNNASLHGRELFRTAGCTDCHNTDQGKKVPSFIVPMKKIFPGDDPKILGKRAAPLNDLMDTRNQIFDDKMIVTNASMRGSIRGIAMPLLLDLARKPSFLHDDSVSSLNSLLDPKRGASSPHPFYLAKPKDRDDVVQFLSGLHIQ